MHRTRTTGGDADGSVYDEDTLLRRQTALEEEIPMPKIEAGPLTGPFADAEVRDDGCFCTHPLLARLLAYNNLRPECQGCPVIDLLVAMPVDPIGRNGQPGLIRQLILRGEVQIDGEVQIRACASDRVAACRVLRAWNEGVGETDLKSLPKPSTRCYGIHA